MNVADLGAARAVGDAIARAPASSSLADLARALEREHVGWLVGVRKSLDAPGLRLLGVALGDDRGGWVIDRRGVRFVGDLHQVRVPRELIFVFDLADLARLPVLQVDHATPSIGAVLELLARGVL